MLITIPNILTADEVKQARAVLDAADWVDGKVQRDTRRRR